MKKNEKKNTILKVEKGYHITGKSLQRHLNTMNNIISEAAVISLQRRMIAIGTEIPFAKIADRM